VGSRHWKNFLYSSAGNLLSANCINPVMAKKLMSTLSNWTSWTVVLTETPESSSVYFT
jgi:hypothetical protein